MPYPKRTTYYNPQGHHIWDETLDISKHAVRYQKNAAKQRADITFNRPEKLNRMEREDYHELLNLFLEIEADDDIKVVVMKGAGPCFSTGHDMAGIGSTHGIQAGVSGERHAPQRTRLSADRWITEVIDKWRKLFKITIVQAHSYCIGIAWWFALTGDVIIASEDAVFGHPAYRWVGASVDVYLPYLIMTLGPKATRKMTLFGLYFDAYEAKEHGLVTEVVPRDQLDKRVNDYAEAAALQPIDGIVISKTALDVAETGLGLKTALTMSHIMHSVNSNIRFEPEEWSFFRDRRDRGMKDSMAERDKRWENIPGFAFPFRPHAYSTTKNRLAAKEYVPFKPVKQNKRRKHRDK
jgi:enoyl-CoA hydratase